VSVRLVRPAVTLLHHLRGTAAASTPLLLLLLLPLPPRCRLLVRVPLGDEALGCRTLRPARPPHTAPAHIVANLMTVAA
jgi:hypothetical protein